MKNFKIIVIGDIMLDEYWFGTSTRISPEAPVPVINVDDKKLRVGGAGNVALNLKEIGINVTLFSTIGNDEAGEEVSKILKKNSIHSFLKKNSDCRTIKKLRVFSGNQQMTRVDFEDQKKNYKIKLGIKLKSEIKRSNLIILSDYDKGSLLDISNIINFAKKNNKKIIVDPKGSSFEKYKGATILTPNFKEISAIVGTIKSRKDLINKSRALIKKLNLSGILVTQGKNGMSFITKNEFIYRDSLAQDIYDVTGAGDTVIAVFSAFLCKNKDYCESIDAANIAASIVIKKIGTATTNLIEIENTLNKKQTSLNEKYFKNDSDFLKKILTIKSNNKKIVMTNGCFDILHLGHIHLLEKSKTFGDYLVVAINSDNSVKSLKGKSRPINNIDARIKMLTSLTCVDMVIVFKELTPENIIKKISPNTLVKGGDYKIKDIIGANFVRSNKGNVKLVSLKKGYSTTEILNRQNT